MGTGRWLILSALVTAASTVGATPANPVGWMADPAFEEATPEEPRAGFHRMLLRGGETLKNWSERVEVYALPDPGILPAGELIDRMAAQVVDHCPELSDRRIEIPAAERENIAVALWHCSNNLDTGQGEVKSLKVVRDESKAFVMIAEGRYPPYADGATPLLREQLERWMDMQRSFQLCTAYTLPGCLPDPKVVDAVPVGDPGPTEDHAIRRAEARARQIYLQDQLAWHATDYVRAQGLLSDPKAGGHFLAMPAADGGGSVYFVADRGPRRPRGLRIDIDATGNASTGSVDERLTGEAEQRYRSLLAAIARDDLKLCSPTANTVVLPQESGDGWLVYVLSASVQEGVAFIGGHNRIAVSARGRVESVEHSANTCIAIDSNDAPPGSSELSYYLVTHVVSDMPWETHLFQSWMLDKPLIVPTDHAVWRIEAGSLKRLDID